MKWVVAAVLSCAALAMATPKVHEPGDAVFATVAEFVRRASR